MFECMYSRLVVEKMWPNQQCCVGEFYVVAIAMLPQLLDWRDVISNLKGIWWKPHAPQAVHRSRFIQIYMIRTQNIRIRYCCRGLRADMHNYYYCPTIEFVENTNHSESVINPFNMSVSSMAIKDHYFSTRRCLRLSHPNPQCQCRCDDSFHTTRQP